MSIRRSLIIITLALTPALASAQGPGHCADCPMNCPHMGAARGGGGWTGGAYARLYDPKTVETVRGEVTSIDEVAPMRGMSEGVHVTLKTDRGPLSVHLGPAWYLDHQDTQLAVGDRVEIRGSRITFDGKPALIAADVRKGDQTLKLRDDQGLPAWRGWR